MQHSDVQLAISRNIVSDLEAAFRALVCQEDKIVTAAGKEVSEGGKRILLHQICNLLKENDQAMPSELCAKLDLSPGNTYAAGAARALTLQGAA